MCCISSFSGGIFVNAFTLQGQFDITLREKESFLGEMLGKPNVPMFRVSVAFQFSVCFLEEIMHPFERVHNLLQNIYIYYLLYTFNHSFKSDTVLYHQKHTLFLKVLLLYLRLLLFLFDCRGFLSKHPVRSDFPESLQKVSLSAAAVTLVKSISQLAG